MTTGQRIKAARKAAGMTQKELGEKIGVSYQGIAQWENDLRNPKFETLQRIADALNVKVESLDSRFFPSLDLYDFFGEGPSPETSHLPVFTMKDSNGEFIRVSMETAAGELLYSFSSLNEIGQQEAVRRINELSEIPKYQRKIPQDK